MVTYSRTALGAGDVRPLIKLSAVSRQRSDLRPLNAPSPLRVQTDTGGRIVSIWRQGRLTPRTIVAVQDRWRIDDEWWREPIERHYYAVTLPHGARLCLFRDGLTGEWFEQGYVTT